MIKTKHVLVISRYSYSRRNSKFTKTYRNSIRDTYLIRALMRWCEMINFGWAVIVVSIIMKLINQSDQTTSSLVTSPTDCIPQRPQHYGTHTIVAYWAVHLCRKVHLNSPPSIIVLTFHYYFTICLVFMIMWIYEIMYAILVGLENLKMLWAFRLPRGTMPLLLRSDFFKKWGD